MPAARTPLHAVPYALCLHACLHACRARPISPPRSTRARALDVTASVCFTPFRTLTPFRTACRAHHTAALSPRASPPVCTPTLFALSTIFGMTPILSFRHYPALIRVQPFLHCISPIRSFRHHPALNRVHPFSHRFRTYSLTPRSPAARHRAERLSTALLRAHRRAHLTAALDATASAYFTPFRTYSLTPRSVLFTPFRTLARARRCDARGAHGRTPPTTPHQQCERTVTATAKWRDALFRTSLRLLFSLRDLVFLESA